jgi:hypothetical protein
MSSYSYTGEETVMWEEDYERMKREEKRTREEERIRKAKQDEIDRETRKELNKIKDKIAFNDELATEICERISAGELLINICNDSHMPTVRRCNQWLKANSDFSALFRDAINDRLTIFEEETIKIADDAANDFKEILKSGKTIKQVDAEVIARAKLRVDVRFRHLKAGKPQKWGDSSTLTVKDNDEFDPANMSQEELEKQIAEIEKKSRIVKAV